MTHPIPSETIEYQRYADGLRGSNARLRTALSNLHDACEFWENQSDPVLVSARKEIAAAETSMPAAPTKTITIHVEGGMVQDVNGIPAGYEVRVEDYDHADARGPDWNAEKECQVTTYEGGADA